MHASLWTGLTTQPRKCCQVPIWSTSLSISNNFKIPFLLSARANPEDPLFPILNFILPLLPTVVLPNFFDRLVQYDSTEYKEIVVPEIRGTPGDLFRLPPLPDPILQNLLLYFSYSDLIAQGKPELKGVRFMNFLFSGSPDYHFANWTKDKNGTKAGELDPGAAALDGVAGWRVLDALEVHDTIFLQEGANIHCGIYLGGRLILHKLSTEGPLWVSTFRELLELTGRWDKIHVRSAFNPDKLAVYAPDKKLSSA